MIKERFNQIVNEFNAFDNNTKLGIATCLTPLFLSIIYMFSGNSTDARKLVEDAAGNFDAPPPQVILKQQQKSISECISNTPENMEAAVTIDKTGEVKCMYAPTIFKQHWRERKLTDITLKP